MREFGAAKSLGSKTIHHFAYNIVRWIVNFEDENFSCSSCFLVAYSKQFDHQQILKDKLDQVSKEKIELEEGQYIYIYILTQVHKQSSSSFHLLPHNSKWGEKFHKRKNLDAHVNHPLPAHLSWAKASAKEKGRAGCTWWTSLIWEALVPPEMPHNLSCPASWLAGWLACLFITCKVQCWTGSKFELTTWDGMSLVEWIEIVGCLFELFVFVCVCLVQLVWNWMELNKMERTSTHSHTGQDRKYRYRNWRRRMNHLRDGMRLNLAFKASASEPLELVGSSYWLKLASWSFEGDFSRAKFPNSPVREKETKLVIGNCWFPAGFYKLPRELEGRGARGEREGKGIL